jgi:hypothetical protein
MLGVIHQTSNFSLLFCIIYFSLFIFFFFPSFFLKLLDIQVLELLEDACESLLDSIVQSQNAPTSAST